MSTTDAIIRLHQVSRFYQAGTVKVTALSGIDMELSRGDFVTIMGPSGGGKTTLLNLMGGLDRPDTGDIHLNGHHISQMDDRGLTDLRRREIGFVFQFFNLLPTLTVWENVELPLLLSGAPGRARQSIATLLDYVGLLNRRDSFPAEMSGGEMQRVAIARALVHRPSIVLADEPTGNLDSVNGHKILDILKEACDDFQTTVVVVTHNPTAAQYGNRHFEIEDGRLKTSSPVPGNG
ncbi:ABC transporter ATP-binding protein [Nitrospina watsonii]|uniref:ABC transporter, ATP-binding component, Lipoprotein-releasing system protein LolD n=1 Tax=Nitrospina watsonii TaxID=1323948 RepID=A0ABM9HG91_9BACT|nr:ABC transporter ATP-binding protein [Nitrospina watsonii]CAI2719056.1 putative ABC transporter, ATP-binding component, Lipoprotein-releasing system protein LolD [Nitrospina watsonii]